MFRMFSNAMNRWLASAIMLLAFSLASVPGHAASPLSCDDIACSGVGHQSGDECCQGVTGSSGECQSHHGRTHLPRVLALLEEHPTASPARPSRHLAGLPSQVIVRSMRVHTGRPRLGEYAHRAGEKILTRTRRLLI